MQGWDSVMVEADVEIGGTDQLFNLLVGRDLQEAEGQERQVICTAPLINGLDGRKMSKSYGNAIGLTDAPGDMFGKTMAIPDDAMALWFEQLTRVPAAESAALLAGHPRAAKARLAAEIVAFYHGADAARAAADAFDRQFKEGALPDDIPERVFAGEWPAAGLLLSVLLREVGLASSSSDARRAIEQGGVKVDGEIVRDARATLPAPSGGNGQWAMGDGRWAKPIADSHIYEMASSGSGMED
jgi:tyrosyl-tRNA synthetase